MQVQLSCSSKVLYIIRTEQDVCILERQNLVKARFTEHFHEVLAADRLSLKSQAIKSLRNLFGMWYYVKPRYKLEN